MADKKKPEVREIAAYLIDLPAAHAEASAKLNEVINAVRDTGKAGSLTLKLKVSVGKLNESMIEVLPDVTAAIPRRALRGEYFYPDEDNNLTKDDPSQLWRGDKIREAPTFVDLSTGEVKEAPSV